MSTVTLYDKYGFEIISEIVHDFYGRVLKSSITAPYFLGIDMDRLINHQTQFLCYLMGGPVNYSNDDLAKMHTRLNITEEAFDEISDLLEETMEDHDMLDEECAFVIKAIQSRRDIIIDTNN